MRRPVLPAVLALALALAGVTTSCKTVSDAASSAPAAPRRVRISGSGTALPLLRILTRTYADRSIDFVYLPGLHSKGGILGVQQGDLEIGAVSRDLTPDERKIGLTYTVLSTDGLTLAAHPGVAVDGLTTQQVCAIYAGTITNWKQVGGLDMPIVVLDRNEDESAKIILRQYVLGSGLRVTPKAVRLFYESDMVQALTATPGAVGYFSLGYGISEHIPVSYLALDGVKATVDAVASGRYRVVRPLGVVVAASSTAEVRSFVQWASGPEAAAAMREGGFTPARH